MTSSIKSPKKGTREYQKALKADLLRNRVMSLVVRIVGEQSGANSRVSVMSVARKLGRDKALISRWMNSPPNWRLDTIADIADSLGVEIDISARDYKTGKTVASAETQKPFPRTVVSTTLTHAYSPNGLGNSPPSGPQHQLCSTSSETLELAQ